MIIDEKGYDELGRPCKELYGMHIAFNATLRSIDKSTKHGSIATDDSGSILATGYNNPVRNSDDKNMPQTRPLKYFIWEHAERNLIYNAARKGIALEGSVFYVTGLPCIDCLRGIIQVGASKLIYGPLNAFMTANYTEDDFETYKLILKGQPIKIEKFKYKDGLLQLNPWLKEILENRPDINIPDF